MRKRGKRIKTREQSRKTDCKCERRNSLDKKVIYKNEGTKQKSNR